MKINISDTAQKKLAHVFESSSMKVPALRIVFQGYG
jgi:hypothetical protein